MKTAMIYCFLSPWLKSKFLNNHDEEPSSVTGMWQPMVGGEGWVVGCWGGGQFESPKENCGGGKKNIDINSPQ